MRNLTFKAAMLNDSRTTVNRQSTDGQSQRHYKQTPLSKRWKVLMTLVFLFTFAIGNVWAADITVVPTLGQNVNTLPYGLFTISHSSTKEDSKISSGAIAANTKNDVITINFKTTKSDMYIKSVTFSSLSNGTLSSSDGTISSNTFTVSGNKSDVNVVLTSNSNAKGTVKITNVVVNTGTNTVETITFNSFDGTAKTFGFTSSAGASSSLTSISSNNSNSVSSNILTWSNGRTLVFAASGKIKYAAFVMNDGKAYTGVSADKGTYVDNYSWTGDVETLTLTNGIGSGRAIKNFYLIIAPATKHHVTYSLGGDYGTTPTQADVAEGGKFTLHNGTTGITAPENKTFAGWSDGTTTYAGGDEYTMGDDDVTLTAQWATSYDISYDKGTYGTGEIAGGKKAEDVAYTLSSSMFTRENYLQVGWATTDGASRSYMIGGSYTTNVAQTFYPAWAEKDTYVAAFHYDSENPTTPPAGWTFANAGTYTNTSATVAYVGKFTAEGETTASGKGMNLNHIAFAKSADADAVYDLGYATTVSAVTGTLMIGSTSAKVASIDYLAADGSTVLHSFNITHNKADWGANNFNETEVVPNVRYIRINGKDFWQVLGAFSVTYGSLVPKYDLAFAKNGGSGADMTTLRYAEDAVVTLPGCTFTAPTNKTFDAWVVTKTASGNPITVTDGKFTMPAEAVTATATWKFLPKLTLTAGEGATGEDVETYHKAGSSVAVPAKPEGFSNGTKEFTGWVYSLDVEITDGAFPMPSSDLTLTAQWASATAVAQILGGDSYETFAGAIEAVADGQTIKLLASSDYADTWVIDGKNVTLDLNGFNLTYTSNQGAVAVKNNGKLTIEDATATADPTVDMSKNLAAYPLPEGAVTYASGKFNCGNGVGIYSLANGEVVVNSGWFEAQECVVLVLDNGKVTVNNGVLLAKDNGVLMGNGTAGRGGYTITVNGGILIGQITSTGYASMAIYHPNTGDLFINGGTLISTNGPAVVVRAGDSEITGGEIIAMGTNSGKCGDKNTAVPAAGIVYDFAANYPGNTIEAAVTGGTVTAATGMEAVLAIYHVAIPTSEEVEAIGISGGTFSSPVAEELCAPNYAPKSWTDGTGTHYGVKPLATSIDIEGYYVDGSHGTVAEALAAHNYTLTADMSDSKKVAWDNNSNAYDKGLKIKEDAKTFSFDVAADKLVAFKTGIISGATLSVNGSAAEDLTITDKSDASIKTRYYYSENAQSFVFTTTTASYNIIKSVRIEDPYVVTFNANGGEDVTAMEFHGTALTLPSASKGTEVFKGWYDAAEDGNLIGKAGESYTPTADVTLYAQWEAVSSDATLSALEVDEATVAGFDPETYIYNIVCEYGLQPTITKATATAGALATVTINNTPVDEGTYKYVQVKVVPQSGEEDQKFYQVRYTNLPKKGVSLIKATHTGAKTADVTGYLGGTYDKNTANDGKLGDANTYFGIKLTEGNFQAGDVLYIHASTVSSAVRIYSDKGTTRINAEDGTFDANKMFTYTLTAETEWIYIYRKVKDGESDMNPYVDYIEVQRHMDPFIAELKVGDALATIDEEANPKTITIEVPASTDITALTPSIKAYANGGATVTPAEPQDFSAGAVEYTVTSYYGETTTYQVTVTKAEASHDATLSALSVAGYSLSPAFDPAVLTYNVELAKGTVIADLPAVSYTLNHVGATAVKTDAAALPGATTIVVTAEDGLEENKKTYTINFTVSTKDKVVIFDGSTMDAIATSPDASGLSWELVGLSVSSKTIGSYTHAIATGGGTSNTKHIKISVPAKYEAQFEIGQATNSNTKERNALVKTTAKPDDSETLFTVSSSNASEATVATSGALAGGKDYYLHSDNSINFVKIVAYLDRVSEAPAISAQPAALAVCDAATNTNALSVTASVEAGTLSYQWYKVVEEGDDVAVGTNSNEFVPTALGDYYVVVTNTEGSYKPSSTKSEIATVSLKAQTEITGFENAAAPLNTEKTLSVTAAGTGTLTYKWQACTEAGVVTDENVLSSAATYGVTITEEPQYYLVTVEGECGSATQVLFAKKWADLELVDVDGSMTWNFAASNTGITEDVAVPSTMVLANAGQGAMPNTDNFHSDMLKAIVGSTGTAVRKSSTDGGCYQGTGIMFHTTVPGIVTVTYRGTGNSANVTLTVGSRTFDTYSGGFTTCDKVFVPAGDVEISSVGTMRIQKIVFNATPDYTRNVTEGRYGTICLPNGGVMTGATLYEVAYYGQTSKKIFFDEILNGEMVAGVPYIFLPKEGATQLAVFYTDEANESAKNANGLHGFIGANADAEMNVPVGAYILNANQYREVVTLGTAKIKSNRSYIELGEISPSEPALAPGRRRISMSVYSEQVATGIENTGFESEAPRKVLINGELYIIRGEKMYDAKGQLVK